MAGHYFNTVENTVNGKPVANASIEVFLSTATVSGSEAAGTLAVTGEYATIFSDDGVTLVSQSAGNLVTTDDTGFFEFWTGESSVVVLISYDGAGRRAITDVEILEGDLATYAARAEAAAAAAENSQEIVEDLAEQVAQDADTAGAAATAAMLAASSVGTFASTTAFIAGSVDGEYGLVVTAGGPAAYYLNVSEVAVLQSTLPNAYAEPFVNQGLGTILYAESGETGVMEWERLDALSRQPENAVDTAVTTGVQFFNQVSTPGGRATLGTSGGNLTITAGASIGGNTPSCVCGTAQQFEVGATYVVEGSITVLPGTSTGLIFAFLNGAPVPGDPTAVTPAGSCLLTMRGDAGGGNGALLLYAVNGALFSGGSIAFPGGGGSPTSVSNFTTEETRLIVTMTSATTAICVPVIGGVSQGARLLTGLPAGCYFGGGLRIFGATCAGVISRLAARGVSLDVVKRLHVDPSAALPGGDGSRTDPMQTLDEAQLEADVDYTRRSIRIALLGGTLRGTISLDGSRWDDITIFGAAGQKAIIKPSVLVTSGWTLVPGSTGGAVYKRIATDVFYPGNRSYGGYVEVGDSVTQSDIYGPDGYHYTVEGWALYSRLAATTAANDPLFVPGSYSRHITGADDGYDFIRCWDDGDPNDKDFERSIYGAGIDIYPSEEDGWTGPKVTLRNFEVHNAFLFGVRANSCDVDIQNVYVRGSQVGYGFELDGSGGRIVGCRAEGCGYDGLHAAGDMDAGDREVHLEIVDFHADGIAYLPQGFGDGMSAHLHNRHRWTVIGGRARGIGKDGAAMSGESRFYNYHVIGAVGAGITAYAQVGVLFDNSTITVEGGIIQGCAQGINANCATIADAARTIDVTGTILLDNDVSILAYAAGGGTAVATVNAVGVQQDNCGDMDSATGGVITTRLSPTLV